ncbi:MAG: hypothetical protein NUV77_03445 [Thermoguttaceae bacterium]|jgi:hypothetical protein|nr:hypothetical protein [Thermoguttaceae bacterium]
MHLDEFVRRRTEATDEFNRHEGRTDGVHVTTSLAGGLTILRDALYARLHDEVEMAVGRDSILMPVSPEKTERISKTEIEVFQAVVASAAAVGFGYVRDAAWCMAWLGRLRLGPTYDDARVLARAAHYASKSADQQRLAFTNVLADVLPESRRAPLVLFRLYPTAVQIATALAFGDQAKASSLRGRQLLDLPSIRDCHQCHGKLLDNGEACQVCGNPLWKFNWLVAAD